MNNDPRIDLSLSADSILFATFGDEYLALSERHKSLIIDDYIQAEDGNMDCREYQRCIGRGNLLSYARVLSI